MTSTKHYAKAFLAATRSLEASERLAWLAAVGTRSTERALVRLIQHPDQAVAFAALTIPQPIAQFLRVLAEDRALSRLGSIATQTLGLAFQAGDGIAARLTTAQPLTASFVTELEQALAHSTTRPVLIESSVEPRVLGGFRLEVGDARIDRTIAGRLAGLTRSLQVG